MPYQSSELLFSHFRDNNIDLSNIDAQLQLVAPNSPNLALYRDMMLTILRLLRIPSMPRLPQLMTKID